MATYFLYWGLLVVWAPLLWPMLRLKGGARIWLVVVIAAGVVALIYEIRMFLFSTAAIRLDILLISVVLVCLYASAAVVLFSRRWWWAAAALAVVIVSIGGGLSYQWVQAGRESQRLGEIFRESNRLLFRAKFQSPESYQRYFGPFAGTAASHPIGHWRVVERAHFTRLIINAAGRVWLFYQCQADAECHHGPDGSGLRASGDHAGRWQASLAPPVGAPIDITITQTDPGTLAVAVQGQRLRLGGAPPPIEPTPAPQSLRFLGPFARIDCLRQYATIRQVWLWQDGARRYAVGIFSTLPAGRRNDFVSPVVLGEGVSEDDGWRFTWARDGRSGTAVIGLDGAEAILTLEQDGRDLEDADGAVLKPGAIFDDERINLAPRTSHRDWRHWFDTVLVGHFVSGDVPAC